MSPWTWIQQFLRREVVPSTPVTTLEEHATAERHLNDIQRKADRLERLARDYRRLDDIRRAQP